MSHVAAIADHATDPPDPPADDGCAVVELRQYTLHPGRRDTLIALFEREFVEAQEACGMTLIGQFRDLDAPDRFVWLRGFADMHTRARALAAFYGGPVWKAHREAANATMLDSDNVLLLRPARPGSGFARGAAVRAASGAAAPPGGLIVAMIWQLPSEGDAAFGAFFERAIEPTLQAAEATPLARFVSEQAANTFPALPVREGENVFACFAAFRDVVHGDRYLAAHANASALHHPRFTPEVLRLAPTARSLLHG